MLAAKWQRHVLGLRWHPAWQSKVEWPQGAKRGQVAVGAHPVGEEVPFGTRVKELIVFGDGALTFQEFIMREPLPLATMQGAVLEFLHDRNDAVLFGAQAVNAYVAVPRMTQDVDILCTRAPELAQELRDHLARRFHVAVRVREIGEGRGYRLFQVQKPRNRHLVDVRPVAVLPPAQRVARVLVATPAELIASKVLALQRRRGQPKWGSDWRDLAALLLAFPELKKVSGPVEERLKAGRAGPEVLAAWKELVAQEILPEDEDAEF